MANKKLDNLFQEQLKNLEATPNKRVWNNIEAQLTKKKRRVFPIWWFTGAVASILVLVFLFYPFATDNNPILNVDSDEIITITPEKKPSIKTTIDSLNLNNQTDTNILISKKQKIIKGNKPQFSNTTPKQKEKKFRTSVVASRLPANVDFNTNSEELLSKNTQITTTKHVVKLDIKKVVENTTKDLQTKQRKNWSVAPIFGIIKSNSLTDTSPINSSLAESTAGERSFAYGVQVAFKINKRWSIQSGIHQQEMNYTNNQVTVNSSSQNNPYATAFANGEALSFDNSAQENISLASNFVTNTNISDTGNITQNYGYIEIPLEVKYNFYNNSKIETQLVSGFSTLFLNKNEVSVITQNFSSELQAKNLNSINFSGNLGFDLNYFLNKQWSFNLNPMFKIQLNTFSQNANGFTPISLGIYTGIRYQF